MSDIIITVENLSKRYLVGHRSEQHQRYTTLRDVISREARNFVRKAVDFVHGRQIVQGDEVEEFWALKDVSFEVKRGEVLGIIGRNGAGKSTLLKILSRITKPDGGRVILHGRVASLLEVGTGFHPELTGRENIFLNGAILGMTRAEITRKFDEIVAFAEVERFLDTPVKHYSSGMYVRLAFAVAAHLEPEILVVDEVLAVGDAEFQSRCLGKMTEVARTGRTILFVSHNLGAISSLCGKAVELRDGHIAQMGVPTDVVEAYLKSATMDSSSRTWPAENALGTDAVRLCAVRVFPRHGRVNSPITSDKATHVELEFITEILEPDLCIGFELLGADGHCIFWSYHTDMHSDKWPTIRKGTNVLRCTIPAGLLNAGSYSVAPKLSCHNRYWILNGGPVVSFNVTLGHGVSPFWTNLSDGRRPGMLAPILQWERTDSEPP